MTVVRLRGFDEISRRLLAFKVDVARRVLKDSLKAIAEFVAGQVKNAAPVGRTVTQQGPSGGELRRSIGVESRKPHRDKQARMVVGVHPRAFYWKFLEFGTKAHTIKASRGGFLSVGGKFLRAVKHPGSAPRPFIRPTWDRIKNGLTRIFSSHLLAALKQHRLN